MRWWTVLSLMILVRLCVSVDLKCAQSRSGKHVTSSVDTSLLPRNKSTCRFSWANGSHVLANDGAQLALVMKKSLDSLQTSECFTELNWKAYCISEETRHLVDFTANCTSCCKLLREDKALWTLLLIPVLLLGCLLYKCRKKICSGSPPSCSQ